MTRCDAVVCVPYPPYSSASADTILCPGGAAKVEAQNRLLDDMGGEMGSASGLLGETIGKLSEMLQSGGGSHMCYLIVFVVFAFVVISFIMKNKGQR